MCQRLPFAVLLGVVLLGVCVHDASAGPSASSGIYYGNPPKGKISSQIAIAHTPGCSYGPDPSVSNTSAAFPPLFLTECTQAIAPTAVDLRGLWKNPAKPEDLGERIEQCGLRIIITGGGVIHDTYIADGTVANGVNDVSYYNCSQPVNVSGRFNVTAQSFTFYQSDGSQVVSRQLLSQDVMQWVHPLAGVVNYTRVYPSPPPPRKRAPPPRKPTPPKKSG